MVGLFFFGGHILGPVIRLAPFIFLLSYLKIEVIGKR